MRRPLLVAALLGALVLSAAAQAHPLGNFTVNRAAEITVSGDRVYLRAVLDLAEIPTFQEGARVRASGFAAELARSLVLEIDGRRTQLRPLGRRVQERSGAGGLPTLRFEALYDGGPAGRTLAYRDSSFAGRIGWREIVVRAERGADVLRSTAPAESPSKLLLEYPRDLLRSPLDARSATARVRPGERPGSAPTLTAPTRATEGGRLASFFDRELSFGFALVSLGLAFFWGAAHALGPGHGKAIVAGYLVGARGTARHALLLGLIVTVTHTAGVFALGLITLGLSAVLLPEQLYPWLTLVSGLLVLGVGAGIVRARLRARRRHHHHHHDHDHHHHHDHGELRLRSLVGVGISGGIVPCPTALVVLLAAISLHRLGYGLVLIVAFSLGLAGTVTGIGLAAVGARRVLSRVRIDGPLVRLLPVASALAVLVLGAVMTARAIPPLL